MAKYRINLEGDRVLAAKLRGLTDSQAKKAILGACRESIKVIQAEARTLAPSRTGALRRSIKVRAISRSRKRIGVRVTTSATDNLYSGKTFYGAFQEFGWKTGSRKNEQSRVAKQIEKRLRLESRKAGGLASFKKDSKRRTMQENFFRGEGMRQASAAAKQVRRQIAGKHFMKRAADSKKDSALEIFRVKIDEYIRKVMKK
jgi:HK97 gp10 family phage protein